MQATTRSLSLRTTRVQLVAALAVCVATVGRPASAQRFVPIDLGSECEGGRLAVNANDIVVGQSPASVGHLWLASGVVDPRQLGTLGGNESLAAGLNDAGVVVGWAEEPDLVRYPYVIVPLAGRWYRDLDTDGDNDHMLKLDGGDGFARDVNTRSQIVGQTGWGDFAAPVFWELVAPDTWGPAMPLAGVDAEVHAVNDRGIATGWSEFPGGKHAAVWDLAAPGVAVDLGVLPFHSESGAWSINERDEITGWSGPVGSRQAVLWRRAGPRIWVPEPLGTLGLDSEGLGVRGAGATATWAVGRSEVAAGVWHGYLWEAGVLTDLEGITDLTGWQTLREAHTVNTAGHIAGLGTDSSGSPRCFLLREPEGAPTMSLGWQSEAQIGRAMSVGDWDADGDLDWAVTTTRNWSSTEPLIHELHVDVNHDGVPTREVTLELEQVGGVRGLAWGDWDGDGDLDLAFAGSVQSSGCVVVYENDGSTLVEAWRDMQYGSAIDVAWGDWDGDGDLDLVAGMTPAGPDTAEWENRIYRNDGGDSLTLAATLPEPGNTFGVAWGDFDGDGDLDLAVANYWRGSRGGTFPTRVYRNDAGSFRLAWTSPEIEYSTHIAIGDLDGDGDLDLVVTNSSNPAPEPDARVYRNDGAFRFLSTWTAPDETGYSHVSIGDVDGDGDLDLALSVKYKRPGELGHALYRNDGGFAFEPIWASPDNESGEGYLVDWDRDGDLDLVTSAAGVGSAVPSTLKLGRLQIFLNRAELLQAFWTSPTDQATTAAAWGDWDGDRDLDLLLATDGGPDRLFVNDGGALSLGWTSPDSDPTRSIAWGDWDGDLDLDLAVAGDGVPVRVFENTGGDLRPSWESIATDSVRAVAWADVDGDGDLDLMVGNYDAPLRLYNNTGAELALAWQSKRTDPVTSLAWGDLDGDGWLDLLVGTDGQPDRAYRNIFGRLADAWSSSETASTSSVAIADWNSDGLADAAMGALDMPTRVYAAAAGSLQLAWTSGRWSATTAVAWGDADADGLPDLAVGNRGAPDRLYHNDGGGLRESWSEKANGATTSLAWGDLDGDGDIDLFAGTGAGAPDRLYRNNYLTAPGKRAETATHPVLDSRPGATAVASGQSTTQRLESPVMVPYRLLDEQSDSAWRILAQWSPNGGGLWLPATAGAGGDPTTDRSASPSGDEHLFAWDAAADGAVGDDIRVRIEVPSQWPQHVGGPVARARLSASSPPFRVAAVLGTGCSPRLLGPASLLKIVKEGPQGLRFHYAGPAAATEHHVNALATPLDLTTARIYRPAALGGDAHLVCDAATPASSCLDVDARAPTAPPVRFYRALAACGPDGTDEGAAD